MKIMKVIIIFVWWTLLWDFGVVQSQPRRHRHLHGRRTRGYQRHENPPEPPQGISNNNLRSQSNQLQAVVNSAVYHRHSQNAAIMAPLVNSMNDQVARLRDQRVPGQDEPENEMNLGVEEQYAHGIYQDMDEFVNLNLPVESMDDRLRGLNSPSELNPFEVQTFEDTDPDFGDVSMSSFEELHSVSLEETDIDLNIHPGSQEELPVKTMKMTDDEEDPELKTEDEASSVPTYDQLKAKVDRWLQDYFSSTDQRYRLLDDKYLEEKSPYKYAVYIMQNKNDLKYYIGTTTSLTTPCKIWSLQPNGMYTSAAHDGEFQHLGNIVYDSTPNPYSSASASESDALYRTILLEVGSELLPEIYQKPANIQQRKTGFAWTESALQAAIVDDIKNGREVTTARPPPNSFFKELAPTLPKIWGSKINTPSKIDEKLIIQTLKSELDRLNVAEQVTVTATEEGKANTPWRKYQHGVAGLLDVSSRITEDFSEASFDTIQLNDGVSGSRSQPIQDDEVIDIEGIIKTDGVYTAEVYVMINVENGAIYTGSKVGNTGTPCKIWIRIPGTSFYKSSRANDKNSVYHHVQSFTYSSTSEDYTQILLAVDAHANYLQLLQNAGHQIDSSLYQKSANMKIKIKPISWTKETLGEHITKDIVGQKTVLEANPPVSHFVDSTRTKIDKALRPTATKLFSEEDMQFAVKDYETGLSILDSAVINFVDPFYLHAHLKSQGIPLRNTNPIITRDDLEIAIAMYRSTEDGTPTGDKTYTEADILKIYPNLEQKNFHRYLENPSLVGNLQITEAKRAEIVNLVRTGLSQRTIVEHLKVSFRTVKAVARYIRRSDSIQEIYGDPDYETANILQSQREVWPSNELQAAYNALLGPEYVSFEEATKYVPGITPVNLRGHFLRAYPNVRAKRIHYTDAELEDLFKIVVDYDLEPAYKLKQERNMRISNTELKKRYLAWLKVAGVIHQVIHKFDEYFQYVSSDENPGKSKKEKINEAHRKAKADFVANPENHSEFMGSSSFYKLFYYWEAAHPDQKVVVNPIKMVDEKAYLYVSSIENTGKNKADKIRQAYEKAKTDFVPSVNQPKFMAYSTFEIRYYQWEAAHPDLQIVRRPTKMVVDEKAYLYVSSIENTGKNKADKIRQAYEKAKTDFVPSVDHPNFWAFNTFLSEYRQWEAAHPDQKLVVVSPPKMVVDEKAYLYVSSIENTGKNKADKIRQAYEKAKTDFVPSVNHPNFMSFNAFQSGFYAWGKQIS